jgi:deleted-in-malignant-brain-tumors protein 1
MPSCCVHCAVPPPAIVNLNRNTSVELRQVRDKSLNSEGNLFIDSLPVCDDWWGPEEAEVACRSLGFHGADSFTVASHFGPVGDQFSMTEVKCVGDEASLINCSFKQANIKCSSSEGAGVICRPKEEAPVELAINTLALVNGSAGPHEGNLLVNGRPLCDDSWSIEDARVVCRSLGFPGASEATCQSQFGPVMPNFIFSEVECNGSESQLTECPYSPPLFCGPEEAAGVVCDIEIDVEVLQVSDLMNITLEEGAGPHEGNLHIGGFPVCDDGWQQAAAEVACRQLGFPGVHRITDQSYFGNPRQTFIASSFECNGNETTLLDCMFKEGDLGCEDSEAAGVVCKGGKMLGIESFHICSRPKGDNLRCAPPAADTESDTASGGRR